MILVPPSFCQKADPAAWMAVFCHELAHWKRCDHVASLLAHALTCLLPWQPLAWWAGRRQEQLAELACDEWVVASGHLPENYAEVLLDLTAGPSATLALAVIGSRAGLAARVRHLLALRTAEPRLGVGWLAGLTALTLSSVSVVALAQRQPPSTAQAESQPAEPAARLRATPPVGSDAASEPVGDLLTLTGRVLNSDGTPAAGALVASLPIQERSRRSTVTDKAGRFQLADLFGNSASLQATTADGKEQAVFWVATLDTRARLRSEVEMKLATAVARQFVVRSGEKPVSGAHVRATTRLGFGAEGVTSSDGTVVLHTPADEKLWGVTAWHPTLGAQSKAVRNDGKERPEAELFDLTLYPPAPYTLQVVDPQGQPVAGLSLTAGFYMPDGEWSMYPSIAAAGVKTDGHGKASFPWAPKDLSHADPKIIDSPWKVNGFDQEKPGIPSVVQACLRHVVHGRLAMPSGESRRGNPRHRLGLWTEESRRHPLHAGAPRRLVRHSLGSRSRLCANDQRFTMGQQHLVGIARGCPARAD